MLFYDFVIGADMIVTVGVSPCWDVTCYVDGIEWGQHKRIMSQTCACAGKAFNVSRALAWLGVKNTAAGLWGQDDFERMLLAVGSVGDMVDVKFTAVAGRTRQNVTVVDTQANREMHLRAENMLAGSEALGKLKSDLCGIIDGKSTVVFAGSMSSGELLDECMSLITAVKQAGATLVVDTCGQPLKRIVEQGQIRLISPNVEELSELLGEQIDDNRKSIIRAAEKLRDKVEMVVVSRGPKGAIVVANGEVFEGRVISDTGKSTHTVGCGDWLLAGFLAGLEKGDISEALVQGIKAATARAWGWCENTSWPTIESKIEVEIQNCK